MDGCQLNLDFLCRVCAANTKGKNSVAECVYILKTIGLRDKLDKFLYLKVFENDALPKVLCKACFRQVEATASLSKIAKHTQQVFRDFLLSSLPKGTNSGITADNYEYTSTDFSSKKTSGKTKFNEVHLPPAPTNSLAQVLLNASVPAVPPLSPAPKTLPLNPTKNSNISPPPPPATKDEVVVNVSVSDPLTRENQQKVISNSQRRHSVMVEASDLSTGNANRSMLCYIPKTIAQKQQKMAGSTSGSHRKSASPARVLQCPPVASKPVEQHTVIKQMVQQPQPPAQVTTFSSGGYVIGPAKESTLAKLAKVGEELTIPASNNNKPVKSINLTAPNSITTTKDNTILQQKRKNLVKALNNIKANNTGQVSLLKSSQQKQQTLSNVSNLPLNEIMAQVPDELPKEIIIAAPKSKATPQKMVTSMDKAIVNPEALSALNNTGATEISPSATPAPKISFPDDILLGRVIRDADLLKLILKALKWPTNKQNMEFQLQRLRNSRFTDIMADANLLQDRDLTQLLGPYLAPVLMAAQALQQQQHQQQQQQQDQQQSQTEQKPQKQQQQQRKQKQKNTTVSSSAVTSTGNPNSLLQKPLQRQPMVAATLSLLDKEDINKAIPYKLPPETSVQLVPALPEELIPPPAEATPYCPSSKRPFSIDDKTLEQSVKRQRKSGTQKHRDSILISDEEDNLPLASVVKKRPNKSSSKLPNNFPIEVANPGFLAHLSVVNHASVGSGDAASDSLLALLRKQKLIVTKQQRKNKIKKLDIASLPPSEFDALINIDENMVLTEPVTTTSSVSSPPENTSAPVETPSSQQGPQQNTTDVFLMPSQVQNQAPLITRPIIKRRKTVIQSAKGAVQQQSLLSNPLSILNTVKPVKDQKSNEESNKPQQISLLNPSLLKSKVDQLNNKPFIPDDTPLSSIETTKQVNAANARKQQHKATLGQQLLEAIGLEKTNQSNMPSNQSKETPSSSTNAPGTAIAVSSTKQSVQQIRSALKKSLKKAQEQQELRNKEVSFSPIISTTVIQDADSTTKSTVKEIVIEGKNEKNSDSSTSFVDVEEQIDKVALVKNQSTSTQSVLLHKSTSAQSAKGMENVADSQQLADKDISKNDVQALKRSLPARITDRRCTLPSSLGRNRQKQKMEVELAKNSRIEATEKKPDELMSDVKSDAIASNKPEENSLNVAAVDHFITPKRRYRKRNPQAAPLDDSEKDKETTKVIQKGQEKETAIGNEAAAKGGMEKEIKRDHLKDIEKDKNKAKDLDNGTQEIINAKGEQQIDDKSKTNDTAKEVTEDKTSTSIRPTRQSKTLSKYYKGPDKAPVERRSLPPRSTRNRKYK